PVALAARERGYEVHVVTALTSADGEMEKYGFIVHPLEIDRSGAGLSNVARLLFKLFTLFSSVKPDVVHLVTIKPVLIGGLAARIARVPSVVYAISGLGHVFTADSFGGRIRRAIVKRWYQIIL